IVDIKCLPTGFSTNFPPLADNCDHCHNILNKGEVLTCSHGYHYECYTPLHYGCRHCEEYYKRGIYDNVKKFVKRLEKGPNILTEEELREKEEPTQINDDSDDKMEQESFAAEVHNNFVNALEAGLD
ncbi:4692_t:CDS:2, partial [Gigaspora rosea]